MDIQYILLGIGIHSFKIHLLYFKCVLCVGLFYLSRLFEKDYLSKVNKR